MQKSVGVALLLAYIFFSANHVLAESEHLRHPKSEVEAFVSKALLFAKDRGKQAALSEFMNKNGLFAQGDLSIFAYGFNGTVLSQPGQPDLVGQNLMGLPDPRGVSAAMQLFKFAQSGGGWFENPWTEPPWKGSLRSKRVYVLKVNEGWFLGCGTFVDPAPIE